MPWLEAATITPRPLRPKSIITVAPLQAAGDTSPSGVLSAPNTERLSTCPASPLYFNVASLQTAGDSRLNLKLSGSCCRPLGARAGLAASPAGTGTLRSNPPKILRGSQILLRPFPHGSANWCAEPLVTSAEPT